MLLKKVKWKPYFVFEITIPPFPPETLINFICRLEEIGAAAAKEHSLEKALEKMKLEWKDMMFEMIPYRETVRSFLLKN